MDFKHLKVNWFVYKLDTDGPVEQNEDDGDDAQTTISTQITLPSVTLLNMWENLYFDNNIKQNVS